MYHLHSPSKMPTGSKGMINQLSNTYVTVVRAETELNDLKNEPSVVTYDTVDCRTTKNIDSPKNEIIESNVVYENEDTFNLSSNNLTSTGSCGNSVIFPYLVGFHFSRQNIN